MAAGFQAWCERIAAAESGSTLGLGFAAFHQSAGERGRQSAHVALMPKLPEHPWKGVCAVPDQWLLRTFSEASQASKETTVEISKRECALQGVVGQLLEQLDTMGALKVPLV